MFRDDARAQEYRPRKEPGKPHPRWSQKVEQMLGTGAEYPTTIYNGYGEWVAKLYG